MAGIHMRLRATDFLAPQAEGRQRSFSNAESSVVRPSVRPSSSVVNFFRLKCQFLKNCLITFFLLAHTAPMGCQLSSMKFLTPLKRSKGPPGVRERTPHGRFLAIFTHFNLFLRNRSIRRALIMNIASMG